MRFALWMPAPSKQWTPKYLQAAQHLDLLDFCHQSCAYICQLASQNPFLHFSFNHFHSFSQKFAEIFVGFRSLQIFCLYFSARRGTVESRQPPNYEGGCAMQSINVRIEEGKVNIVVDGGLFRNVEAFSIEYVKGGKLWFSCLSETGDGCKKQMMFS
jgi:hypothetical protein